MTLIATFCVFGLLAAPAVARTHTYTFRSRAFDMNGFQVRLPKARVQAPRLDGYITAMRAFLVYDNGRLVRAATRGESAEVALR